MALRASSTSGWFGIVLLSAGSGVAIRRELAHGPPSNNARAPTPEDCERRRAIALVADTPSKSAALFETLFPGGQGALKLTEPPPKKVVESVEFELMVEREIGRDPSSSIATVGYYSLMGCLLNGLQIEPALVARQTPLSQRPLGHSSSGKLQ